MSVVDTVPRSLLPQHLAIRKNSKRGETTKLPQKHAHESELWSLGLAHRLLNSGAVPASQDQTMGRYWAARISTGAILGKPLAACISGQRGRRSTAG